MERVIIKTSLLNAVRSIEKIKHFLSLIHKSKKLIIWSVI